MFPSILNTFSYPTASNRLNNPSHSAQHTNVNSIVGQIEAVIGLADNSSTLGTLIGDLRSPGSNGGGHVQTANKGGTGQTVYAKGDILAGASSSVLSKLAIGTDGQALVADSSQSSGIKWGNVVSNKVVTSVAGVTIGTNNTSIVTIFSASVLGSILGTNNAIRFTGEIAKMVVNNTGSSDTVNFNVKYGGNVVASISTLLFSPSALPAVGKISGVIMGNLATNAQRGFINIDLITPGYIYGSIVGAFAGGSSATESSANQNLVITAQFVTPSANTSLVSGLFVVEKIA